MRQSMAKGTRRELRRAIGVNALDHVQAQDQAVAILQNAVVNLQREVATLAVNHAESNRRSISNMEVAFICIADERRRITEFVGRPFVARLRWLFTGK